MIPAKRVAFSARETRGPSAQTSSSARSDGTPALVGAHLFFELGDLLFEIGRRDLFFGFLLEIFLHRERVEIDHRFGWRRRRGSRRRRRLGRYDVHLLRSGFLLLAGEKRQENWNPYELPYH